MSCRKAYEVDLAGYVADPTSATWTEFRDHYPRCAPCSAEVRAWTELTTALGAATHPDPDVLLRWVDAPAALAPTLRHAIADHVARCAACRDEARTLRTFDPLAEPAPARAPRRRFALPSLWRIVWNPVFAYAVALMVGLYPLLSGRLWPVPVSMPSDHDAGYRQSSRRGRALPEEEQAAPKTAPIPRGSDSAAKREAEPAPEAKERLAAPAAPPPPPAATVDGLGRADREADAAAGEAPRRRQSLRDEARQAPAAMAKSIDAPARIVLRAGEETIGPARDGDVRLAVEGAPPGVERLRLQDDTGRRIEIRWSPSTGDAHVSGAWLRPGRYTVELLAGDAVIATARLRIETP